MTVLGVRNVYIGHWVIMDEFCLVGSNCDRMYTYYAVSTFQRSRQWARILTTLSGMQMDCLKMFCIGDYRKFRIALTRWWYVSVHVANDAQMQYTHRMPEKSISKTTFWWLVEKSRCQYPILHEDSESNVYGETPTCVHSCMNVDVGAKLWESDRGRI